MIGRCSPASLVSLECAGAAVGAIKEEQDWLACSVSERAASGVCDRASPGRRSAAKCPTVRETAVRPYYIGANDSSVTAWSTERMPFPPTGWLLVLQKQLKSNVLELSPVDEGDDCHWHACTCCLIVIFQG